MIANENDEEEAGSHYSGQIDDNVMMMSAFLKDKAGRSVFQRSIAFVCGNVTFHLSAIYHGITSEQSGNSGAINIQRFRCILDNSSGSNARNLDTNSIYSMRTHYQACFVLDGTSVDTGTGPRIIFTTDSINRILDVDSSDLHEIPFLSLVAEEDNEKTRGFLDKALNSDELVLERLQLLVDPLEASRPEGRRTISVEFMAMGSDDGAVMLCQLDKQDTPGFDNGRYIPLEEIISSDPETSDFPERWSRMGL
ncbi:hypothetical protein GGI12_006071 [Dipsacomyces acuminosporus]|nr:hypothetical protein GGI12_006071 [Dipsacomyces acuminosporus]